MKWLVFTSRSQKWILSAIKLFAGVLFSLTGIFFGQTFAASMEDEKFGLTGKVSKVLGGVVVRITKGGLTDHTALLMNLVPLNRQGHPLCRKTSGHLVTVFKNRLVQSGREHSAFVVMEDPSDPPSPHLMVGDCLTIKARKVIPLSGNKENNEDRIMILPGRSQKKRFFQAFLIKLWPEQPALSSGGVFFPKIKPVVFRETSFNWPIDQLYCFSLGSIDRHVGFSYEYSFGEK